MTDHNRQTKLLQLAHQLINHHYKLGTAESCTGGGLSFLLTTLPGSSNWFERGLVTYSNEAKMSLLHVKNNTLDQYGAVSKETAHEMVEGLLTHHPVDVGIAITGIAGPDGGSVEKPVGTVWIACKTRGAPTQSTLFLFTGDRESIRSQSIDAAVDQVLLFFK